jgi:hypothetical protein
MATEPFLGRRLDGKPSVAATARESTWGSAHTADAHNCGDRVTGKVSLLFGVVAVIAGVNEFIRITVSTRGKLARGIRGVCS